MLQAKVKYLLTLVQCCRDTYVLPPCWWWAPYWPRSCLSSCRSTCGCCRRRQGEGPRCWPGCWWGKCFEWRASAPRCLTKKKTISFKISIFSLLCNIKSYFFPMIFLLKSHVKFLDLYSAIDSKFQVFQIRKRNTNSSAYSSAVRFTFLSLFSVKSIIHSFLIPVLFLYSIS